MKNGKQIPITTNFSQTPDSILGKVEFLPEGVNPFADTMMKAFASNPLAFRFEVGYVINDDGQAELIEISLVPNRKEK